MRMLLLVLLVLLTGCGSSATPTPTVTPRPTRARVAGTPTPTLVHGLGPHGVRALVLGVVDGGTIQVRIGRDTYPVGYLGVQITDEARATAYSQGLVGGIVELEKDYTDRDARNRLLRYVWNGDALVNGELIAGGMAGFVFMPLNAKNADLLQFVSANARQAPAIAPASMPVVAAAPPAMTATIIPTAVPVAVAQPVVPTVLPARGGSNTGAFVCTDGCAVAPDPSCAIKGNVNSSGDRIYHMPGGMYYDRTDIKPEEGDRWFCTTVEAEAAGFRASER